METQHSGNGRDSSSAPTHDWRPGFIRVFLSHVHEQASNLGQVRFFLEGYGINGFLAHADLRPDAFWRDEILRALKECQALIAFCHPRFASSDWANQEVGFALGRGIPVLGVHCGAPPTALADERQAIGATSELDDAGAQRSLAHQIYLALSARPDITPAVTPALVAAFESATSFRAVTDSANALLARSNEVTANQVERLRAALRENSHCSGAYVGTERVEQIAAQVLSPDRV